MTQQELRRLLQRPIAFHRVFAEITGSATAGLFLSQLFYWSDKGHDLDGWFYKTQAEWEVETALTRYEQERARMVLRQLGILEEERRGIPAQLWYRLNTDRLMEKISTPVEIAVDANGEPVRKKRRNSVPPQVRQKQNA